METLTQIPDQIDAGTSVEYTRTFEDYPASDGWTLKLILQGASKLVKDATTNADGLSFDLALTAADTTGLTAGVYEWTEKATLASPALTKIVASGRLEVFPDVEAAAAGALQSWEEKALAMVEKAIAYKSGASESGRLSSDIEEYEIAGRRVVKHDLKELYQLRTELRRAIRARLHPGRIETSIRTVYSGQIRP